jgi:hypothetical protein
MLPAMALLTLAGSLIESKFMLPSHLAHGSKRVLKSRHWFNRIQGVYDQIIKGLIRRSMWTPSFSRSNCRREPHLNIPLTKFVSWKRWPGKSSRFCRHRQEEGLGG